MAPRSITAGMTERQVRQDAGAPSEETRLSDGRKLWWYIQGPQGFTTWRVVLGGDGTVTEAAQVLTEANFRRIAERISTRADVLAMLGRPRESSKFPNLQEDVLTWRYQDGTFNKFLHVHFGPDGVVRRYVLETEQTDP